MGTSRYTDEQVKEMALQGAFTDNSVLAVLLHSRVDVEGVPFVEGFYITRLSHNSICISVREKKAVGCIPYLDSYIYFDRKERSLRALQREMRRFRFLTESK